MEYNKFPPSVERKAGWYQSNRRETGDQPCQELFTWYWPTHSKYPASDKEAAGNCNVSPIWKGSKKEYFYIQNLKIWLCHSLALILFFPSRWGDTRESNISTLLSCFFTNYCHTASGEIMLPNHSSQSNSDQTRMLFLYHLHSNWNWLADSYSTWETNACLHEFHTGCLPLVTLD